MKSQESDSLLKVGITCGDPNGVGIEVIIKTFQDNRMLQVCSPVIYAASKVFLAYKKALAIGDFNFTQIKDATQVNVKNINLVSVSDEDKLELGQNTQWGGKLAFAALEAATADLKSGKIDVLVTAPINKDNIQSPEFTFPGHTEYLAKKLGEKENLMLMIADDLRIAVVTGHIPLSEVSKNISTDKIIAKTRILLKSLIQDFGIRKPRIAVLGVNPHAGDNGLLGKDEIDVVIPAVELLRNEGNLVYGPYSADGFFGTGQFHQFDAVLAMYHDQGLIPFKSLSFGTGVNYTAGMEFIRTSPDHGTGFGIAGKNLANEASFRKAIYMAVDMYKKRQEYRELSSNPLKVSVLKKERG